STFWMIFLNIPNCIVHSPGRIRRPMSLRRNNLDYSIPLKKCLSIYQTGGESAISYALDLERDEVERNGSSRPQRNIANSAKRKRTSFSGRWVISRLPATPPTIPPTSAHGA